MKIDTQLRAGLGNVAAEARALEEAGFDGAFSFEGPNDVFFPLVEAALASGLDLYTNVAIAFPRSPMHLAHQCWDLQRLSEGRFTLGLGTQVKPHIERRYGATWDHPVERMREWVEALRAIFACWQDRVPLDFRGKFTSHTLMPPTFDPGPLKWGAPPIWVGAVGPKMTRMVAMTADGLLVHPFTSERFLHDYTVPLVTAGLAEAGRSRADFSFGVDTIVCAGRTDEEMAAAELGTRGLIAFYGSTPAYRPVLDFHGRGELQPELRRLTVEGRWAELPGMIDDELLDTIAIRGTPAEVATELERRYGDVADRVGFYLPYKADPEVVAEVIAHHRAAAGR